MKGPKDNEWCIQSVRIRNTTTTNQNDCDVVAGLDEMNQMVWNEDQPGKFWENNEELVRNSL